MATFPPDLYNSHDGPSAGHNMVVKVCMILQDQENECSALDVDISICIDCRSVNAMQNVSAVKWESL